MITSIDVKLKRVRVYVLSSMKTQSICIVTKHYFSLVHLLRLLICGETCAFVP